MKALIAFLLLMLAVNASATAATTSAALSGASIATNGFTVTPHHADSPAGYGVDNGNYVLPSIGNTILAITIFGIALVLLALFMHRIGK